MYTQGLSVYSESDRTSFLEDSEMHKILFAFLLALVMTLALFGVKRVAQGNAPAQSRTMVADGAAPVPIPW